MLQISRRKTKIIPDFKKVIPRFFNTGNERAKQLIERVLAMPDQAAEQLLNEVLQEFADRYLDIHLIFDRHYQQVQHLLPEGSTTPEKKALIGSYFTMEYAIEAAALFNPSIVEDPNQAGLLPGQKRVILSFRATGESHLSSLVFRGGLLDENGEILLDAPHQMLGEGVLTLQADTSYELHFNPATDLSERVIFPVTFTEKNGIEDARFVKFTDDDGAITYYATYTAYDGTFILPKLIETKDFCQFKTAPLIGKTAVNKNLALFPRKINGQYVMLSRIDGANNYIMFSNNLHEWNEAVPLQQPVYPWELVQVGNGGAPIETEKGWLVITHGVGPMRKYCLGASLYDLNDPTKQLGRLPYPLLMPNEDERNGYVPNVVYTCGTMIHGTELFIPYAISDFACSFASTPLQPLLEALLSNP
jgi:predicted GH43/DUF377 family glycosyl hydrolase